MNVNRKEDPYAQIAGGSAHMYTWCMLSFTDAVISPVISPATYSMSTLCQCVSELCQCVIRQNHLRFAELMFAYFEP